tara:strand:+ start:563 stop:781 length:219 start_codon:yes stop_codon:yes gene_type:complete
MNKNIDVNIFSPGEPLGIFIIFCGIIFSGIIFYVIFAVSTNKESIEDKKMREKKSNLQQEKISKLFPKKRET